MSSTITLAAESRERAGKGAARAIRRAGRVPGVVYGDKKDPIMVSVEPIELNKHLHRAGFFSHIIELKVGGDTHRVLPRDVQFHPVNEQPLHIDFLRVGKGTRVTVMVPVHFINEAASPGIKRGGVLNIVRHEVELRCDPENIPEELVVDLTGREIGDSARVREVALPEGVALTITDRDFMLASIAAPTAVKDEAAEAAAEAEEAEAAEAGEEEEGEE